MSVSRKCNRCGLEKELTEFGNCKSRPGGKQLYCLSCGRSSARAWYRKNRKAEVSRSVKKLRLRRAEFLQLTAELKAQPCADCGSQFDPVAMDFDHRDRTEKLFSVSDAANAGSVARQTLLDEIRKCDIVCAVCHRLRTFDRPRRKRTQGVE